MFLLKLIPVSLVLSDSPVKLGVEFSYTVLYFLVSGLNWMEKCRHGSNNICKMLVNCIGMMARIHVVEDFGVTFIVLFILCTYNINQFNGQIVLYRNLREDLLIIMSEI